jgi:hypothetical protein
VHGRVGVGLAREEEPGERRAGDEQQPGHGPP